jgi:hypothetical protein
MIGRCAERKMDLAGAAQSHTGGDPSPSVLARVMHRRDRDVELPLLLNPSPLPTPRLTSYLARLTSGAAE